VFVEFGRGKNRNGCDHEHTLGSEPGERPRPKVLIRPDEAADAPDNWHADDVDNPADQSPWAATVVLGNGESAFVRPLVPADGDDLAAFHRRQSRESIYKRFFSPKPELTEADVEHFTDVDMVDRAALAVEVHDEFVAWASYERWPGRNDAEVAFMVDDDMQGRGIATLLLEHLAAIARSNGIERFTAEVLAENRSMLAVFARAGWPLQRRFDSGVVDLDWDLETTEEFLDSVERREQRADSRAIARILLPRAVTVIGASPHDGTVGAALWKHVSGSVSVPAYPVNPRHDEIHGVKCYASVDDLPDDVSLAVVAVPPHDLDATIDSCIEKRMRGAIIITSTDLPGVDVDIDALVTRARRNGLRIIGPSSMGVASPNPDAPLQAALVDVDTPVGGVAVSMQSGSLGGSLLRQAGDLELGLTWFVSLGDKADVSANDLLQAWLDDDNVRVVALYTEAFGNPAKFARIARRMSLTRPIVAVHTGAVTGSAGKAMYQQTGVIEVPTVADLLDTCRVFCTQPVMKGPRVAVITNSRSPASLLDTALESAHLQPRVTGTGRSWESTPDDYAASIESALSDDDIDGIVVVYAPAVANEVNLPAAAIDAAAEDASKPVVTVSLGTVDGPLLPGSAVPNFAFPEQAAAVLARSWAYGSWLAEQAEGEPETHRHVDPATAHEVLQESLGDHDEARPHVDLVQRLLASYGVDFAPAVDATPDTAVTSAQQLGFPVAIKAHKRRPGRSVRAGVALDLDSQDDVVDAIVAMTESLQGDAKDILVQRMVTPGVDVRVRCRHDDRLGVVVNVGLGGEQADAIGDTTSRLAPLSPAGARSMINDTRVTTALVAGGFDPSPLVDVIVQAAQLAADHDEIEELDLNPVIVSNDGAVATDATLTLRRHDDATAPIRRLD